MISRGGKAVERMIRANRNKGAILLLCAALATACGGSGGAQQPPPPPTAPPGPQRPDATRFPGQPGLTGTQEAERKSIAGSSEFAGQWSLAEIGADYAYARGYSGSGVTVGIIDTGVDPNHAALAGKLHALSGVAPDSCPGGTCLFGPVRDTATHGTLVAGIIAAAKLGKRMHGVAHGAELLAIGMRLGTGTPVYRPVDLSNAASFRSLDQQGQGIYRRLDGKTRIVNHSFGYEGVVTGYTARQYRAAFGRTVDSLMQAGTPDSDKTILVWAAGNSFGKRDARGNPADASSPDISAGTPHLFPELKRHFITVVATQADGAIAPYSNRCGVAADFCMAAPGSGLSGPRALSGESYARVSGTSAAAPNVAGALALMEEAFRGQLGSTEMASRLFAAADKSGIYANRQVYGQGLLDVEKATRPIGAASVALSGSLGGPAAALEGSAVAGGGAWGDAMQRALAGRELAIFDSLNAPFFVPMESFGAHWTLDGGRRMDQRFAQFAGRAAATGPEPPGGSAGKWTVASAAGLFGLPAGNAGESLGAAGGARNAWIALGTGGVGIARGFTKAGGAARWRGGFFIQQAGVARSLRLQAPGRAQGAFVDLQFGAAGSRVTAELGFLREPDRLLGAGADGAYGQLAGNTWFARFAARRQIGAGLGLMAVAQAGFTAGAASHGLFGEVRRVRSSAYSAGLEWNKRGRRAARLWFSASQPLRNESGGLALDYPVGRTRAGSVLRETTFLSAVPSGRQIDLVLGYETVLGAASNAAPAWRFRCEAWRSFQPGHRARAAAEGALFAALSRSF